MNRISIVAVGLAGLAIIIGAPALYAAPADYEFQPVAAEVKTGAGTEVAVRLVHKPSGKPVDGAVIIRTRLDMSPDSMDEMTAKHISVPSGEPGIYRFRADFTMAGGWAFKLQAKLPRESETIKGTVVFQAK